MEKEIETIELDLDKEKEFEELSFWIKKKKIKVGEDEFFLRLFISHSTNDILYGSFLLFLSQYFLKIIRESHGKKEKDDEYFKLFYNEIFSTVTRNFNTHKLENQIEKEFKVKIDLEKKNPLDQVFGIWKNEDISLEKIREKAWQRNN